MTENAEPKRQLQEIYDAVLKLGGFVAYLREKAGRIDTNGTPVGADVSEALVDQTVAIHQAIKVVEMLERLKKRD